MKKRYLAAIALLLQVFCFGCSNNQADSQTSQSLSSSSPTPVSEQKLEFNTSEKDIQKNNNISVAAQKVMSEPGSPRALTPASGRSSR